MTPETETMKVRVRVMGAMTKLPLAECVFAGECDGEYVANTITINQEDCAEVKYFPSGPSINAV